MLSLGILGSPALSHAAGLTWLGQTNNDWSNAANWSLKRLPGAADTAVIDRPAQVWLGAKPGSMGTLYLATAHAANLYVATGLTGTAIQIGRDTSSNGTLVVSGTAGRVNLTGNLTAGINGRATVDLYNASHLQTASVTLGQAGSGSGTLVATGRSALDVSGTLVAGAAGKGSLALYTDASAKTGAAVLGLAAGSTGSAVLAGGATRWSNAGTLSVGVAGVGALELSSGARLTTRDLRIATAASGTGSVKLSNGATRIDVSGALQVGAAGKGALALYSGAGLSAGSVTLGEAKGGSGALLADGGGTTLTSAGALTVGNGGSGNLSLSAGARARAASLGIAKAAGSSGAVTLSGGGTTLSAAGGVEIGRAGSASLLLTGGSQLDAPDIALATSAGSTGTLSIGSTAGTLARGAGALNASTIRFGAGSGRLVFNLGGPTYAVNSVLSGRGTIDVQAGDVALSANSSAFTGLTRISGGTLSVNGTLGGSVAVSGYGTLSGTGTVGSTTIGKGGRIAPAGSATGGLTVNGNLGFATGSHYQASVAPLTNSADRLTVTGRTTIATGTVLDVVQASAIDLARQDTILSSAGGITGNFDNITSNYAFVTPSVRNDGSHLLLTLARNDRRFSSAASTASGAAAAEGLTGLGKDSALYRQVLPLSARQAASTFQDLAGSIHAAPVLVGFDVLRFGSTAALERLRSVEPGGSQASAARADGLDVWGRAYAGWSHVSTDDGSRNASVGGLFLGLDTPFGETGRIGLLGGFGRSSFTSGSGAEGSSDDYTLGLYASEDLGPLALRLGAQYTAQTVSTSRTARFNGFTETLEGDYRAGATVLYTEAAYRVETGEGLFEPFATLSLIHEGTEAFSESGGNAALDVSSSDLWLPLSVLGVRTARHLTVNGETVGLHGMLGWQHAFDTSGDAPVFSFQGGKGFSTPVTGPATDSLLVEAGLDWQPAENASLALTYDGSFGAGSASHMLRLNFSRRF